MLLTFCLIFDRYEVQTVGDVLDHLDDGLQHVIQAGIDRANQSARVTAHMICDWRIMPNQFTYEVKKQNQLYSTLEHKQNDIHNEMENYHWSRLLKRTTKQIFVHIKKKFEFSRQK